LQHEALTSMRAESSDLSGKRRVIADFELLAKIGQGGMGAVYKARQRSLDRIVALKLLPPAVASDKMFVERFQREARASAKLDHPNIIQGIATGFDDASGEWYFAMEYVDGPSLKQVLKQEGRLDEERVLGILRDMGHALDCAQKHGFVHRDIKPDNILLAPDGTAKLADLGLARRVHGPEDDTTLTQSGQTVGTPAYMAPEQIRGEREKLDIRSDLYSLGASVFHLLTGRQPYEGPSSAVVMSNHLTQKIPLAHVLEPSVSERLSRVIAKLMQKEREQRIQSPAELLKELDKLSQPEKVAIPRAAVHGVKRESRPQREAAERVAPKGLPITAMAIGACVLVAVLVVAFGSGSRKTPAEPSAPAAPESIVAEPAKPPIQKTEVSPQAAATKPPELQALNAREKTEAELSAMREQLARKQFEEIKAAVIDAAERRKRCETFVSRYGSTVAGKEAAEFLKTLTESKPVEIKAETAVAPPVPAPAVEPRAQPSASPELIAAYNLVVADVFAQLRNQHYGAASDLLAKAKADAAFAPLAKEIERDSGILQLAATLPRAAGEGATKLADKRSFTFVKTDGKDVKTGTGTKNTVKGEKDGVITIEQDLGGGQAQTRLKLEQLSAPTFFELCKLGVAPSPQSDLLLALGGGINLSGGATTPTAKQIQDYLGRAEQNPATLELAEHLRGRVALFEREAEAEPALKRIDALLKEKQWQAAADALQKLKADFAGTQALKRLQPEVDKRIAAADAELHPMKPGLWGSFWNGEGTKKLLNRVEASPTGAWQNGSPDPAVPNDWFLLRLGGTFRIDRDATYHFQVYGDDYTALFIDGKLICEAGTQWCKNAARNPGDLPLLSNEVDAALTKGEHAIRIEFREALGVATYSVNWKNAAGELVPLPVEVLSHDPRKAEEYERAP
jgi:serine/threonine protein kinase